MESECLIIRCAPLTMWEKRKDIGVKLPLFTGKMGFGSLGLETTSKKQWKVGMELGFGQRVDREVGFGQNLGWEVEFVIRPFLIMLGVKLAFYASSTLVLRQKILKLCSIIKIMLLWFQKMLCFISRKTYKLRHHVCLFRLSQLFFLVLMFLWRFMDFQNTFLGGNDSLHPLQKNSPFLTIQFSPGNCFRCIAGGGGGKGRGGGTP